MAIKRIGIDARLLTQTGVGVYIKNLLLELHTIADDQCEFYIYVREEDKKELRNIPKNSTIRISQARWHSFSEQTIFLQQLLADNLDLMHFCYFSMPILYNRPFVITIHDVIPFNFATGKASTRNPLVYGIKHVLYKNVLTNAVRKAKKIFVPTDAVKHDIEKLFPLINSHTIVRTYEGIDANLIKVKPSKPKSAMHEPYFLYVGNFYPHKNVPFLIDAFSRMKEQIHLVLCGPEDFFAKKIDAIIQEKNLENRITRISTTSIEERAYLYTHARALIHPSKNEGFGLPLLEAAYFHCPAIVSDIPVFREVRPHAQFFKLDDVDGLVALLTSSAQSTGKKSKDGIEPSFSFNIMAKETYNQYIQCL